MQGELYETLVDILRDGLKFNLLEHSPFLLKQ